MSRGIKIYQNKNPTSIFLRHELFLCLVKNQVLFMTSHLFRIFCVLTLFMHFCTKILRWFWRNEPCLVYFKWRRKTEEMNKKYQVLFFFITRYCFLLSSTVFHYQVLFILLPGIVFYYQVLFFFYYQVLFCYYQVLFCYYQLLFFHINNEADVT